MPRLAVKLEMSVIARGSDKPHSISIQTGLNPVTGITDCQWAVCAFVDWKTSYLVSTWIFPRLGILPVEISGVGLATAPVTEEMARAALVRRVNFILIRVEWRCWMLDGLEYSWGRRSVLCGIRPQLYSPRCLLVTIDYLWFASTHSEFVTLHSSCSFAADQSVRLARRGPLSKGPSTAA